MATKSSFKQPCPSCEAMVPIRDPKLIGRKIDCPKCKYRFVVEEPADEVEEVEEVEEEAPAKKGKGGATDITNQKPSNGKAGLQRRADDDEDVEEAPKKKKSGGSPMLIVGISLAAVAVVALAVGGYFLFSGKSDDKPSGGPSANANPGNAAPGGAKNEGGEVAQTPEDKDKPKAKQDDVTNLLPNETHAVLNLPLARLLANSKINQAMVKTPGAFHERAFQSIWGVPPSEVSRVVLACDTDKKTVFSVMRTRSALKEDKIVAALQLKLEASIEGQKYYLLTKPLDGLSTFLFQNALRKLMGGSGDQPSKIALHFMDPFTVVCADVGPMTQFLKDKGQPKHLTKSAEDEAAQSDANAQQPSGQGGPRGMRGRRPGGMPPGANGNAPPPGTGPQAKGGGSQAPAGTAQPPGMGAPPAGKSGNTAPPGGGKNAPNRQAGRPPTGPNGRMPPSMATPGMFPGSSGPSDAAPVSSSYLTVDPELKAVLDQVEKADALDGQQVLLSLALSTSMISLEGFKTLANQQGDEIPKLPDDLLKLGLQSFQSQLKAVGLALTQLNNLKLNVNAAVAARDTKLASEWEKSLNAAATAITESLSKQGVDVVAKNSGRTNSSSLPGGGSSAGSPQPGQFPGPGGIRGMPRGGAPGMQGPGGGRGMPRGGFPGMQGPGGFPGQETPELDQNEEKGKDGDYSIWTKENVLGVGVHFKMNDARYQKVGEELEFVSIYLRGLATLSHSRSRIHDLAAAIQAYFHEKGHFPPGTVTRVRSNPLGCPPDRRLSWLTQILRYLGSGEFQGMSPKDDQFWYEGTANQKAGFTLIPYFLAPGSSFNSALVPYPNIPVRGPGRWAATHFVGIAGVGLDAAEYRNDDKAKAKLRGVFGYDRVTKKDDIKDGLDQTIVAIQVPPEPKSPWIAGGGSTVRGVSDDLDCVRPFVCVRYPNKDGKEEDGTFAIMADGKVRFIPASIDPKTFQAMCTIAGEDRIRTIDAIAPEVPPPDEQPSQPVLKAEVPPPPEVKQAKSEPQSQLPPGWKVIDSKEGRYRVALPPGQIQEIPRKMKTPFGEGTLHQKMVSLASGSVYMVQYLDVPGDVKDAEIALDGYRSDLLSNNPGGQVKNEKKITLAGRPGRQFQILVPEKGDLSIHVYVDKNRFYALTARAASGQATSKDIQAFFDSFQIMAP